MCGAAELLNLVDLLDPQDQYSVIFNGNAQPLDQLLISENIAAGSPLVDIVHTNLDFGFPALNPSDHDPIVAQVDLSTTVIA